jgi:A/G-specific adenine glycosylase
MTHIANFGKKIITWYQQNKRNLPWRNTTDPYKIWVSEIILQQTRVNQGLDYYNRFIASFPTISILANAPEIEVMKLWQGLGYYSRARNMHYAAKQVVNDMQGQFPNTFEKIKKLKGVGDYTAAAIASIAFDQAVPVVDGNVFRVLSRVYAIETPINSTKAKKEFFELAGNLLANNEPAYFNQALMEYGALQCVPQSPDCSKCIFITGCLAYKNKLVALLPHKNNSTKVSERYIYYIVLTQGSNVYMEKRARKDIWQNLYDFPAIESTFPISIEKLLTSTDFNAIVKSNEFTVGTITEHKVHKLSHLNIHATFIRINLPAGNNISFYSEEKVLQLPVSKLIDSYIKTKIL